MVLVAGLAPKVLLLLSQKSCKRWRSWEWGREKWKRMGLPRGALCGLGAGQTGLSGVRGCP